ncbi:MAG: replication-relaxation family protein [Dehalococcoidia bacterium]|nr:replication-relaxation family protein [Dehalococcoidia bacterium]
MSNGSLLMIRALSENPFIAEAELAGVLGEPLDDVGKALTDLRKAGIAGRVSHSAAPLPTSWRCFLTREGIKESSGALGFGTVSEFVRAYPMSREWLRLLIGRMDAVSSVYRLAATLSPGRDGLRTGVEFHRKGNFDATITLHDGRAFGVVRQGLALPRRSLNERLTKIHENHFSIRPDTILILTPSPWERDMALEYWEGRKLEDGYVAAESVESLAREDLSVWRRISSLIGGECTLAEVSAAARPGPWRSAGSPARKRATIPDPVQMTREAPTFGMTSRQKLALDIVANHSMIPRGQLRQWLNVSDGRVSQVMSGLIDAWDLVERHGKRPNFRYALSGGGISYIAHRDRTTLETARGAWSADPQTDPDRRGPYEGSRNNAWSDLPGHADGITWILSKLAGEANSDESIEHLLWTPEWRSTRKYHHRERTFTPDAVVELTMEGRPMPFFIEYERRARHPAGVRQRLYPYQRYYGSPLTDGDLPPFPYTLFVVDSEAVAATYVTTAAAMGLRLPILVSSRPALAEMGCLGRSWHLLWERASPRAKLSELSGYTWSSFHRRMERRN